jgi:hypothetical protein
MVPNTTVAIPRRMFFICAALPAIIHGYQNRARRQSVPGGPGVGGKHRGPRGALRPRVRASRLRIAASVAALVDDDLVVFVCFPQQPRLDRRGCRSLGQCPEMIRLPLMIIRHFPGQCPNQFVVAHRRPLSIVHSYGNEEAAPAILARTVARTAGDWFDLSGLRCRFSPVPASPMVARGTQARSFTRTR